MGMIIADPVVRRLLEAEGYLELELPSRALEILERHADWASVQFEASVLAGEALRQLNRHREALRALDIAAKLRPEDLSVALAQGWCFKRTHRLAQAIDALERAERHHPDQALVRYNLACYWSLANKPPKAIAKLAEALALDASFGRLIAAEADFDPVRKLDEFKSLAAAFEGKQRTSYTPLLRSRFG
jgi:tetratricopeptide (TPR) repeat protein